MKNYNDFIIEKDSNNADNNSVTLLSKIDINDIPKEIRDKCYIDYEPLVPTYDINDVENDSIVFEGLEDDKKNYPTISAYDAIVRLQNMFSMSIYQFQVLHPNGIDFISIKKELPDFLHAKIALSIPNIKHDYEIIENEMHKCGYFCTHRVTKKDKENRNWLTIIFDPKEQKSITEQVKKKHRYAYHTTLAVNANNIEEKGIIATKNGKPYHSNNERVYLYLGNPDSDEYQSMMTSIAKRNKKNGDIFKQDYVQFEIALNKLPADIEFFIDIHGYGLDFVYVNESIPSNAIVRYEDKEY